MPIYVYHCAGGHRFERLVPRDATPPACPDCGGVTRKVPAVPSLVRGPGPAHGPTSAAPAAGNVPIPWRGVLGGGPEKMRREVAFRQRLQDNAVGGLRIPGGPDVRPADGGGPSSTTTPDPG